MTALPERLAREAWATVCWATTVNGEPVSGVLLYTTIEADKAHALIATAIRAALDEAAKVARQPYSDAVGALGPDEPLCVGAKITAAIEALKGEP